jgi:hypothetical protein
MVNVVKGGGRAPPTLTSLGNFTLMMECTNVATLCTLWSHGSHLKNYTKSLYLSGLYTTLHSLDAIHCTGLTWLVYTAQCWLYIHWPDLTGVHCTVLTLHALAWLEWWTHTQANLLVSPAYRQKSRILRWKNIWVSFISCFINLLNRLKFSFSSRNFSCNEKWYHKDIFN